MEYIFVYSGKMDLDIDISNIEELLKIDIASQQKQYNNGSGDDNPNNLEIVDYAYVVAEPKCYMINAKWKITK